jgi:hypothetical protein
MVMVIITVTIIIIIMWLQFECKKNHLMHSKMYTVMYVTLIFYYSYFKLFTSSIVPKYDGCTCTLKVFKVIFIE